jgi:hypothetical protein
MLLGHVDGHVAAVRELDRVANQLQRKEEKKRERDKRGGLVKNGMENGGHQGKKMNAKWPSKKEKGGRRE